MAFDLAIFAAHERKLTGAVNTIPREQVLPPMESDGVFFEAYKNYCAAAVRNYIFMFFFFS